MILEDLHAYYELKPRASVLNPIGSPDEVCPRFWTVKSVSWEITVSSEGEFVSCLPLVQPGTKDRPLSKLLPDLSRTAGVCAYALADNGTYVFGLPVEPDDEKKAKRAEESRAAFLERQHAVLDGVDDEGARGFLSFVEKEPSACGVPREKLEEIVAGKGLIAFRLESDEPWRQIQCRPAVKEAWERYAALLAVKEDGAETAPSGTCLVTGEEAPVARLFPQVSGVPGANSSGASLVSFNQAAFLSYGQEGASISQDAAYKCGEALRYLLKSDAHHMRMGKDSIVFWTGRDSSSGLGALGLMLFAGDPVALARKGESSEGLASVSRALQAVKKGLPLPNVDEDESYFVLGIAPYQARLAVRFFEQGTLGDLREHLESFLRDTEMVGVAPRSMRTYLQQTAPLGDSSNIPSPLITSCMRALLRGTAFPASLFEQLLARMRADRGTTNPWDMGLRAAMMKAYLVRRERTGGSSGTDYERRLTVALNKSNDHIGYLLGRLFAVLEKVQVEAIGGGKSANVNATIRDRYMASAATTPGRVFPQLIKLAQHHISKSGSGFYRDLDIREIMALMPDTNPFPATLGYDQQGEFYVGYYQQKEALYAGAKKDPDTDVIDDDDDVAPMSEED